MSMPREVSSCCSTAHQTRFFFGRSATRRFSAASGQSAYCHCQIVNPNLTGQISLLIFSRRAPAIFYQQLHFPPTQHTHTPETMVRFSQSIVLLALHPPTARGFTPSHHHYVSTSTNQLTMPSSPLQRHSSTTRCTPSFMTSSSDTDHNNDDDDEEIDPNSLGDWRQFRMNLANSGFSSPSSTSFEDDATSNSSISSVMSIDGINLGDDNTSFSSSRTTSSLEKEGEGSSSSSSSSMKTSRPKSVSKRNEELLRGQNEALAEEYLNGVWAHESAVVSV